MKKIKVISCMITVGIMALIFFFSSQNSDASSRTSHGLTIWFLNYISAFSLISDADKQQLAEQLSFAVRKTAHFTIYSALGASSFVSFRLVTGKSYKTIFIIAAVFCMLYAVSDEFHQWFVSGRAGRAADVFIDTAGAAAGAAVAMAVLRLKRKFKKRRQDADDHRLSFTYNSRV